MADLLFSNNASALLNTSILAADTSIELQAGLGANFPQPSPPNTWFYATLEDDAGNFEVVRVNNRATDILTVVRGQDNTVAQDFTQNVTRVELRLTAAVIEQFCQKNGDVMTGDLDMDGNQLLDAVIDGPLTQILGGEIVGVPLRGATGDSSNEIAVPSGGGAPTIGGSAILKSGDDIVAELDTGGTIILDSATVGVRIPSEAFLRIEGTTNLIYGGFSVNADTDFDAVFANLTDLNILSLTGDVVLGAGIGFKLTPAVDANENIESANFLDFSFESQTYSGQTTINVDYQLGSYVTINLNATQTTNLNITDVPTKYAAVRFKVVQDATGGRSITNWPSGAVWGNGNEPPLDSMAANAYVFVDMWTDNGGVTWYGGYGPLSYS